MKLWAAICVAAALFHATAGRANDEVGLIVVEGSISPATASYISRGIQVAANRNHTCVIIQLNTPGGLVKSTERIVDDFYSSRVPVIVYVAPAPASAASAGALITMAADIAAMAPHTRIGAAHPVNIGQTGSPEKVDDAMQKKQENDMMTFAETIADKRHRNVEWARAAVRDSVSATAETALEQNVIDLIATDVPDLLKQIDGRELNGKTLRTANAAVIRIPMTVGEKVLKLFLQPEVMFVFMLVVIYGIIGELSSPGAILPGVAGAIALIIVLSQMAIVPINLAGISLLALALILFVIDVYATTHGVLTGGGIIAFFLGALMLFNRDPAFHLSLGYIIPGTLLTALFFLFVVGAGLRAQLLPVRVGRETMLGKVVPVMSRVDAKGGQVFIEGEIWNAVSDVAIEVNQPVEVVGVDGLTLRVKPRAV
jgi:membrane-bound serine protease (ClpP class)